MTAPLSKETVTAGERVLQMRDDFMLLVAAYNEAHQFEHAQEAQALVIALHKFEDEHDITRVAWPPKPDDDGGLVWIEQEILHDLK